MVLLGAIYDDRKTLIDLHVADSPSLSHLDFDISMLLQHTHTVDSLDNTIINFVSMPLQMCDCFGCLFRLCGVTFFPLFLFRLGDYHMHHEFCSQRMRLIHDLCMTYSRCDCVQLFVSLSCCCHSFFLRLTWS